MRSTKNLNCIRALIDEARKNGCAAFHRSNSGTYNLSFTDQNNLALSKSNLVFKIHDGKLEVGPGATTWPDRDAINTILNEVKRDRTTFAIFENGKVTLIEPP